MRLRAWRRLAAPVVFGAAAASCLGHRRERARAARLSEQVLAEYPSGSSPTAISFEDLSSLPTPVQRYFRTVLTDGQGHVGKLAMRQSGVLRTRGHAGKWHAFEARHLVAPSGRRFFWNARIAMAFGHMLVQDSYIGGTGTGRVSLMSIFPVARETGIPELNSGALHRFLAEAVWYPTALLPESGVQWKPLDGTSALASLEDHGTTVSLEFRFNQAGEVTGIYTPGRFRRCDGGYRQVPWEGHFRDYRLCSGMRVPGFAEVGWYAGDDLELVWKASVTALNYEFIR